VWCCARAFVTRFVTKRVQLLPNNAFGRYPVTSLNGPRFTNQDVTLAEAFAVTEMVRFTPRGEAYNVSITRTLGYRSAT
jgi:hypothetical protein